MASVFICMTDKKIQSRWIPDRAGQEHIKIKNIVNYNEELTFDSNPSEA